MQKNFQILKLTIIIRKLLGDDKPKSEDYEKVYSLLEKNKDNDLKFYYLSKGKLLEKQNRLTEAKTCFLKIVEYLPELNYNLCVILMRENEMNSALYYLNKYCDLNYIEDPTLLRSLIKEWKLLTLFFYDYMKDKQIIQESNDGNSLYQDLIKSYNASNYEELLKNLEKKKQENINPNILKEISLLEMITNKILEKLKEINGNLLQEDNLSRYLDIARRNHLLKDDDYLVLINKLINTNYKEAILLLKEFICNHDPNFYQLEIQHMYRKIDEKSLYNQLSETQKDYYQFSIEEIIEKNKNKEYKEVIENCKNALKEIPLPIFKYYLGKSLYKMKRYVEAQYYFDEYLKEGGEKEAKSLLYLECIRYLSTREENPSLFISRMDRINQLEEKDFTFSPELLNQKNTIEERLKNSKKKKQKRKK